MKDWSLVAQAMGLEIPDEEFERISAALDKLEAAFRPLVAQLHPGVDEAVTYIAPAEKSE
jgi:hypothetical protein